MTRLIFALLLPLTLSALTRPSLTATAKGPNQVNLTWPLAPDPGYGFLVEVQSAGDSRYTNWTELQPIPPASGYPDDAAGVHVYQPPTNGLATWVTEPQYVDPQDGTPAQFIAAGLKPATTYKFRARTYRWYRMADYSPYSNVVAAITPAYVPRFVSPTGSDTTGDGSATKPWATLAYASKVLTCGQVFMIAAGTYLNDALALHQVCTPANKLVVMAAPGADVTIVPAAGAQRIIGMDGTNIVLDGLHVLTATVDYEVLIAGSHNAMFNCEVGNGWGVHLTSANHALIYHSYLHDAGSVSNGGGGFTLTLEASTENVIWSNHFTRGSHDVSLCKGSCIHNRWLNNVMDGGWGMGFEAIEQSTTNLIEGNVVWHTQQLMGATYKPCIEISSAANTVRRNLLVGCKSWGVEVSALYGGDSDQNVLVYNNILVDVGGCLFQSANDGGGLGDKAYDGFLWANTHCSYLGSTATDMYRANFTSQVIASNFYGPSSGGKTIIWGHTAPASQGGSQYPIALADAQNNYSPPFSLNTAVNPRFTDQANGDYHIHARSPMTGNMVVVTDPVWPMPVDPSITVPVN